MKLGARLGPLDATAVVNAARMVLAAWDYKGDDDRGATFETQSDAMEALRAALAALADLPTPEATR